MKIFRYDQIKEIDEFTIRNEPVASIDLMERAAAKLFDWYTDKFNRSGRIKIFAGPGNNGGDGLALARMLAHERYEAEVFYIEFSENRSRDWQINRKRLEKETSVPFTGIRNIDEFPLISEDDVIIDSIFGSGISRPAEGLAAEVIARINNSPATVVSVDIPSGMFGEVNDHLNSKNAVMADYTLSLQFPKLAFMFPECEKYTGEWFILPIGLDYSNMKSPYNLLEKNMVAPLLKQRNKFDHKGKFGHGLLAGGSYGRMGAIVLGARAALCTGAGLITCHIPSSGNIIIQTAVPEAMAISDASEHCISGLGDADKYDAAGIGPGMGTESRTQEALHQFLQESKKPLVIDADALNILSMNKEWIGLIHAGAILTPHPKEFERLAGETVSSFDRLKLQMEFAKKHGCVVVLKGAHTSVASPDGNLWFNSTGNHGMATAGSGDVLTGMILSLLSQGYGPAEAAITGVYLHGLAGDLAAEKTGYESLTASDIISATGNAFRRLREI
ncbi:MAG: NAD(P)H-hydrate dehydratase [Bacteroidota bacterium]